MKKFLVSLAVAALALPTFAQSAPARVAVIDVNKVLMSSSAGKVAYERLKKMQDDRVSQAKKLDDEIASLDKEINEKKLSLSEEKLNDMTKRLSDKKIAMQRFAQDADRDIGEARDKALAELEQKIKPVIDTIGKEMGLAAIFNKFESGLVYASDAIDITDSVVKRFNEMASTASAAPAAAPAAAKKQ
jgi:outer membrane protein